MCMFIDSEVLLANLLSQWSDPAGVSFENLEQYSELVKKQLAKRDDVNFVSFQLWDQALKNNMTRYPDTFEYFLGKYQKGVGFSKKKFDPRVSQDIREILEREAKNYSATAAAAPKALR